MKTNLIIVSLIALLISSCGSPRYLPTHDMLDVYPKGSFIKISHVSKSAISRGELIAIDEHLIIVLTQDPLNCAVIPLDDVSSFRLYYAKPVRPYGFFIPIFTLLPFVHGVYGVFSIPIHLLVTIPVALSGRNAFIYRMNNIEFDQLKMFARFPQGIPPDVDLATIR